MAYAVAAQRSRPLLVALILLHLAVISHQVDGGQGVSLLQGLSLRVLSPLQRGVRATISGGAELWRGYGRLRGTYEENRRLSAEVERLERLLLERSRQSGETEHFRELLGLRRLLPLETVVAEVLSRDGVPFYRGLTIDKGAADGVGLDSPVISPTGIVGRVIAVGPRAARVQVLLDRDCGVGVLVERSRANGVVSGQATAERGTTDLVMNYVPEQADVAVGDVVITSGFDRIYPKGLVVGRVRSVGKGSGLFKDVRVEPSARFDRLEEVLVVRPSTAGVEMPEAVR